MEFLAVSKPFTVSESTTEMFPVSKAAMMSPESHSMSESTASVLRRLSQNSCHGEHQDDDCQAIHCVVL